MQWKYKIHKVICQQNIIMGYKSISKFYQSGLQGQTKKMLVTVAHKTASCI